jgi:GntR family transcriptional regulator
MFFAIEPTNGVPIYEQIVRQIKFAVADGVLVAGQMVPSVRQLSGDLAINPNTIARAYNQLQDDKVLEALRGRGLAVRGDALQRCQKARQKLIVERLRAALSEAHQAGLSDDEVRQMFDEVWGQLAGS